MGSNIFLRIVGWWVEVCKDLCGGIVECIEGVWDVVWDVKVFLFGILLVIIWGFVMLFFVKDDMVFLSLLGEVEVGWVGIWIVWFLGCVVRFLFFFVSFVIVGGWLMDLGLCEGLMFFFDLCLWRILDGCVLCSFGVWFGFGWVVCVFEVFVVLRKVGVLLVVLFEGFVLDFEGIFVKFVVCGGLFEDSLYWSLVYDVK